MEPDQKKIFDKMFFPESVAIVGISRTSTGLGGQFFLKNLQRAGYAGRIYPVNPTAPDINGIPAYPNISSLPEIVDLIIVCVPARLVPSVLEECIGKGVRNVHILSSGYKELETADGTVMNENIQRLADQGRLNVIGPNCMGPYIPASRLMLWGQIPASPGSFAFLSQSGTLTQRMSEHAHFMGFGISKAVSYGNATVLDSPDYLEYLASDDETKVIGFYLESVRDGRRFLRLARSINTMKPLIIWKGGESASGAGAVASHTGTLSGEGRIWDGALKQAGITLAGSLEEVAGAAMAFLYLPPPGGRRTFILGGGGGYSVYYADTCSRMGLEIPRLTGEIRERMAALIPSVGSFARNPVDAWKAFYDPDLMARILELAFESPSLDMIIVDRLIPRKTYAVPELGGKDPDQAAIDYLQKNRFRKPLAVVVDGEGEDSYLAAEAARLRRRFCRAGIPAYSSFSKAAHALAGLAAYYERGGAFISSAHSDILKGRSN